MWSRRMFLAAPLSALPVRARGRIDLSRISAITDEIARSSADAARFARQYGLQWVELRAVPGGGKGYATLPEPELRAEAQLLKENGLRVSFLNTSMMKICIPGIQPERERPPARMKQDEERYARRMDELHQAIEAAKILGATKIRVFTGWRAANPIEHLPRIAEIINEMAPVAEKAGVQLLVENEAACNVGTCAELAALMKLIPSKAVGINWDPDNGQSHHEPPYPAGYDMLPKKRIQNVQIKGRTILDFPQKLDWRAIFDALDRDGYSGEVGLETHIFGEGQIQASHDSMKAIVKLVAS